MMDTPDTRGAHPVEADAPTDDAAAQQPQADDGYRDNPDPDARVDDPSDNSPDEGDEPRGLFEQFADDLDAGRITPDDAVRRLVRGLASQERGDSEDEVRAAFYPGESEAE